MGGSFPRNASNRRCFVLITGVLAFLFPPIRRYRRKFSADVSTRDRCLLYSLLLLFRQETMISESFRRRLTNDKFKPNVRFDFVVAKASQIVNRPTKAGFSL